MAHYSNGIRWQSERLDDLNSRTITWECSQEWTWQVWPWGHNLMSSKPVASQIAMLQQPHLLHEVDQKLGHKSPPVRATLNLSTMLYCLIKARAKQCPITLSKEDQGMTLLENGKEHLVSWDETKAMIARNHAQCITVYKKIRWWRHLGWISIQGKEGSGTLGRNSGRSNEENWGEACWDASLHSNHQSTHKCIEKEVPGMRGDQPFMRQLVTDSSYKKWRVGVNPPKRFMSYKRRMRTRWAATLPI